MRVLITGSNGLLGQTLSEYCIQRNLDFLATSKGENRNPNIKDVQYRSLDITSIDEIEKIVSDFNPSVIINTAAVTNVDFCETNKELCDKLNIEAVSHLLRVSKENGIHLIHLSTDFVFDGQNGPYSEDDPTNALSYYGKSKEKSEKLLIESDYSNWSIVRTIIVFGITPNMSRSNIVLWAKSALEKGDPLNIVDDQFRAPTYVDDLAIACLDIAKLNKKGIFHISGPETFSILELVKRVGRFYGLSTDSITPISSESLNQAAKRPPRTGFVLDKAYLQINYKPRTFEESLEVLKHKLREN